MVSLGILRDPAVRRWLGLTRRNAAKTAARVFEDRQVWRMIRQRSEGADLDCENNQAKNLNGTDIDPRQEEPNRHELTGENGYNKCSNIKDKQVRSTQMALAEPNPSPPRSR
jgi:hypothetical protein